MISILLASYNGEKFISEQIDSLLNQTMQDFKLFICDDKSEDKTLEIISNYAKKYPEKIFVSQGHKNSSSAKYNFIKMMIEHKDDYIMLCDQDDVWLPYKIEKSLAKIRELETVYGVSEPLIVHSDLKVVDKDLNTISSSYIKMAYTSYEKRSLNNLITRNIVAGCTAMYNRALADLITDMPEFFVIHDWWVALIASAFGRIGTIYEPTILYRQHGNNSIGAKKELSFGNIYYRLKNYKKMSYDVSSTYKQAKSFLSLYRSKLSQEQCDLLEAYTSILRMSRVGRLRVLFMYKIFMYGFVRKLAQVLIIFTERRVS